MIESGDALVRVTCAAICGSDLWPYKSMPHDPDGRRMGHEFIGVVDAVGADVETVRVGDLVVSPFLWSDGTCVFCSEGLQSACLHGGRYGWGDALAARVGPGKTVAVVGDGAVGLCGVIASKCLGADRIILLGSNPERVALGEDFGATDVVRERGDDAVKRVRELTQHGAHSVLECVGLEQAVETALAIARPGGAIGRVGVPESDATPTGVAFWKNATMAGGPAPVRAYYIEELLPDVARRTDPAGARLRSQRQHRGRARRLPGDERASRSR